MPFAIDYSHGQQMLGIAKKMLIQLHFNLVSLALVFNVKCSRSKFDEFWIKSREIYADVPATGPFLKGSKVSPKTVGQKPDTPLRPKAVAVHQKTAAVVNKNKIQLKRMINKKVSKCSRFLDQFCNENWLVDNYIRRSKRSLWLWVQIQC